MPDRESFAKKLREFLYGMFGHETALQAIDYLVLIAVGIITIGILLI